MKKIFLVRGMHCASCARNIENSVKKLKCIKSAVVNFATSRLYAETEGDVSDDEIMGAICRAGDYKAYSEEKTKKTKAGEEQKMIFLVQGLDNPHCAMTIKNALKKIGVEKVNLNINTRKASITSDVEKEKI